MTKRKIKFARRKRPAHSRPTNDREDDKRWYWERPIEEFTCAAYYFRLAADFMQGGEFCARINFTYEKTELPLWIKSRPGTRPPMWWMYSRESPRLGVNPPYLRFPQELRDAQHRLMRDLVLREPITNEWETEPRYLMRRGLLTLAERRVIPPEIVKPQLKLVISKEDVDE